MMTTRDWAGIAGVMAVWAMLCLLGCIACVMLSVKLYTEFIKEKKYRQP